MVPFHFHLEIELLSISMILVKKIAHRRTLQRIWTMWSPSVSTGTGPRPRETWFKMLWWVWFSTLYTSTWLDISSFGKRLSETIVTGKTRGKQKYEMLTIQFPCCESSSTLDNRILLPDCTEKKRNKSKNPRQTMPWKNHALTTHIHVWETCLFQGSIKFGATCSFHKLRCAQKKFELFDFDNLDGNAAHDLRS